MLLRRVLTIFTYSRKLSKYTGHVIPARQRDPRFFFRLFGLDHSVSHNEQMMYAIKTHKVDA